MVPARDLPHEIGERRVRRDRDQLGSRNHHLACGEIGKAEHPVQHLFFLLLEHAGFLAGRDQHLQFFFRMDHRAPVAAVKAERLDQALRHAVYDPDERPQRAHEQFQRFHHPQRRGFRALERDPFGCQLAKHDFDSGDDRERNRHRDAVGRRSGQMGGEKRQRRLEDRRERRLRDPAEAEAGHGDAELCGRDVPIRLADGAPDRAGAAMSLRDQLIDPRLAHRDDGELRGDEKAVREHERPQSREPPQGGRQRRFHQEPPRGTVTESLAGWRSAGWFACDPSNHKDHKAH